MKELKLVAKPREEKGSGPAGRLRREGIVPAVIYGEGKPAKMVQVNAHEFEQVLRGHTGEHMLVDLTVEGTGDHKVLIEEVQHHPVSGKVIHADFHEVSMTKKLSIEIPIELMGEPVGVTQQGGVLEHILREVEVECLPQDILEEIQVDVTGLGIGDSLTVEDIKLDPAKYEVLSEPELAIAAVAAPRIEEEPVAAEEEAVEGAEGPEVITEKKEEGEEAEAEGGEKGKDKGEEG